MIIVGMMIGTFIALFAYCACVMSSECSRYEEEFLFKEGFRMNEEEKVYVLIDESNWNDVSNINIVGVYSNHKIAESNFKSYLEKVKEEVDFYNLDAVEDTDEDIDNVGNYVYEETENYFLLYLNGYYDNNHILIKVADKTLIKDLEGDYSK